MLVPAVSASPASCIDKTRNRPSAYQLLKTAEKIKEDLNWKEPRISWQHSTEREDRRLGGRGVEEAEEEEEGLPSECLTRHVTCL